MESQIQEIYSNVQNWTLILVIVSITFCFIRLAKGPKLADRVVALDSMAVMFVAIITIYAIQQDQPIFLDAGILLAIISFLGTVAFSRYLEKRIEK